MKMVVWEMRCMVKARKILGKNEIMQMDYINFMLEAAASSARFGTITEWQPKGRFTTRANINACLVMPFGSGKSTNLIQIKPEHCVKSNDMTFAGMIGTISKDGDFNEGSIIKAAGKLLVVDEFQSLDDTAKNAMNSLLEYPHTYSRNLGFQVKHPIRQKGKYFSLRVEKGCIDLYCKFSCITGGMYINKKNDVQKAWFSRFVPVVYNPTLDWYKKMTAGLTAMKINPQCHEGDFQFRNYMEFHADYWAAMGTDKFLLNYFDVHPRQTGYVARNLQDVARLSCFIASLEGRQIIKKSDYLEALKFRGLMLKNAILTSLTDVEMAILEHAEMSNSELALLTETSIPNISQRRKELEEAGILFA